MNRETEPSAWQDPLTLEDVAILADRGEPTRDTVRHLDRLVRTHPLFSRRLLKLQALARDAGVDKLSDGLLLNNELDQLLEAPGWQHPAQVLDPQGEIGISYPELLNIVRARARRAEDPTILHAVRRKLEQAQTEDRAGEVPLKKAILQLNGKAPGTAATAGGAARILHEAVVELQENAARRK